ncbi:MAG TPA: NADH-quinone oxidoreductase subunit L [Patescibacteria group bacterium]|nr:NADH-quinone oxidoreductase subunit L [Patescibacteria group bacterium]
MIPYSPWLVWLVPTFSSLFVPLISRFSQKARNCFAVIVSLATTIFALSMVPDVFFNTLQNSDSTVSWIPSLGIEAGVLIDPLAILFASLVSFFSLVIIIYSLGYMKGEDGLNRYYFFMLLFIGAMNGLVLSDNFLQMFVFWEIVGLCSYSLVSFWYKRPEAVRAGSKVFLMTRVGDVCLLAAIALLYVSLHSFSFHYTVLNIHLVPLPTLTAVAFLILGAALAKSAQLPLHTWLYNAMEAPTSVSALLHGATMVKGGIYLIARAIVLFGPLVVAIPMWLPSIAWIGAITAFVGATMALHTNDIKGVPAYSTISQIGFMMAALGTASSSSSPGWFAGLFHLISHAFFQGLGFLTIGGIVHALGTRDMRLMGGLRKALPITFGLSMVVLLARTGVPPFASFFSKGLIISSLWSTGDLLLVITIYASAAVTFAYTLRFITLTFLRKKSDYAIKIHVHEPPNSMLIASGILAVLCTVWGFAANLVAQFMQADVTIGVGEIFSSSTLIFVAVLFLGGFPVYLSYFRKPLHIKGVEKLISPVNTLLEHGYFFDDLYEKILANGLIKVSKGIEHIESAFFSQLPFFTAKALLGLANGTHKYLDILVDEMLYAVAHKTLASASKVQKTHDDSLQRYIAVALIGFLMLLALIILTMLR